MGIRLSFILTMLLCMLKQMSWPINYLIFFLGIFYILHSIMFGERENRSFFFCQVTKSEKHAWNTIRIVWFSNTSNSRCKVTRNFLKILHPDRLESYATIGMISILQREGTTKTYQLLDEHYGRSWDSSLPFFNSLFF